MTLREILDERHISGDTAITVKDGCCTMMVSRRYLEGGWEEILDSEVESCEGRTFVLKK